MMNNKYWIEFWENYTKDIESNDEQTQVLRTKNKQPITDELWKFTLQEIDKSFPINRGDRVLDLCAGNGLFSKHFQNKGAEVVAVDISQNLLKNLDGEPHINPICSDIRALDFESNSFNKVFFYAGIQYLNNKETVLMLQNISKWLQDSGILFVGDIPDIDRKWHFYNTDERKKIYFDNLLQDIDVIGNWFEKDWLTNLGKYCGFKGAKHIQQHEDLIYSNFRFDFIFKKK